MPTILEPADAAMAAAMLRDAGERRSVIVPRGSGTKRLQSPGVPPDCTLLSTRALDQPIAHYAGDLVASLPAGATLAEANAALARERQWLPLDPPYGNQATIGGIVAANDSGPRRHQYGSTRDLIIGIEVALTDGRVAKAGGRVVKNVAGYDLARLMCGSQGRLAIITNATFKLAPLPSASRTLVTDFENISTVLERAAELAAGPLSPSAIELSAPSARLLVRFETTERAVSEQSAAAERIVARGATKTLIVADQEEAELWAAHEASVWNSGDAIIKVSVLPTGVTAVMDSLHQLSATHSVRWRAIGRAVLGVLAVSLAGEGEALEATIPALRGVATAHRGSAVVLKMPAAVAERVEAVGGYGDAQAIMQAVKAQFDPNQVLRPL